MTRATLVVGALLILVGSGGFIISSEPATLTVLLFGIVIAALAIGTWKERLTALLMHIAVVVSFVGMILSATSLRRFVDLVSGETMSNETSIVAITILGVLCLIHVTMSIRWFLARKRSSSA